MNAHIVADHENASEGTGSRCLHSVRQEVEDTNAYPGGMAGGPKGLLLLALVLYILLTVTGADSAWFAP